ncbi:MAG: YraN family protein [Proteobacteria bacterium]|nr:YraN family protein [Pseudomonadota bacterium]
MPGRSRVERGVAGEALAEAFLRARGYRIVERNFRCKVGEIDIVARDASTLVFAEVRSRSSSRHGRAAESITADKQRQIARVASAYIAIRRPTFQTCRFDVVDITAGDIDLIKDAFRLGL